MSSVSFPTDASVRRTGALALAAVVLTLSGCGERKTGATQVAAKVNQAEISVHQINFVLQRTPGVTPETADAASRQILERLISQELAVQQAKELKLDRTPATVQALEAARRDVLARAYVDSLAEQVTKPTADEVAAFYADKPALFKERKVYTFQEVSLTGTSQQIAEAQAGLAKANTVQAFADYLRVSGLQHSSRTVTQPAENLPLDLLDRLAALTVGQALFLPRPGGGQALVLLAAQQAPVSQERATAAIEKFLVNDRRRLKTESGMKTLRDEAKVEFMGKFAQGSEAAASSAAASAPQVAAEPAAGAASGLSADVVRKGLSGIK